MSTMKKVVALLLTMLMVMSLVACGNTAAPAEGGDDAATPGETYVLKVNSVLADSSPNAKGLYKFEEYLEEKSEGRIDVQIYTGGGLASSDELSVEMVMSGGCEMAVDPTYVLASKVEDAYNFWVTCFPYIWANRDSGYEWMNNSKIIADLSKTVEDQTDIKIMGWYDIGYNVLANNKRPLVLPGDGNGLKMRVAVSPIMLDTLEAFGPTGVAMAYGEVYTSLTQGTVDGVQTSTANLQADLFYEQCDYVTLTNHYLCIYGIYMNEPWFNSLPADLQAVVEDACKYLVDTEYDLNSTAEADTVAFMESQGIEVITFDELDYDAWFEASQVATEAHVDEIGRDFYQSCLDEIAEMEAAMGITK